MVKNCKKISKDELGKEVHFLRFGTHEVTSNAKPMLPVTFIAKVVRQPIQRCYHSLASYKSKVLKIQLDQTNLARLSQQNSNVTTQNINDHELDQLISERSLTEQADKSMLQRVEIFNKNNPARQLKLSQLKKIFREHSIRKKSVKRRLTSERSLEKRQQEADQFFAQFTRSDTDQKEILMADECVFSSKGYQTTAWMPKGVNLTLSKRFKDTTCVAALAVISSKRGLIDFILRRKSIKSEDFVCFMERVKRIMRRSRYSLLLDNCSVHKSKLSREALKNVDVLWNIPYSPWYNGIELFWAQSKKHYRRRLLKSMLELQTINFEKLVKESLMSVKTKLVQRCADHTLRLIREDAKKHNKN